MMVKVRAKGKERKQGSYKPWTVAQLIVDLKKSGLTDEGISAYLRGLIVDNQVEVIVKAGATPTQIAKKLIESTIQSMPEVHHG